MQQYLLPSKVPGVKGFEIVGSCTSCEKVRGDYYDFVDSREGGPRKFGIAVVDVSGHGVGADLLIATVREVLHSQVGRHQDNLGEFFRLLNVTLLKSSGQEQFMAMFFGVLDQSD